MKSLAWKLVCAPMAASIAFATMTYAQKTAKLKMSVQPPEAYTLSMDKRSPGNRPLSFRLARTVWWLPTTASSFSEERHHGLG